MSKVIVIGAGVGGMTAAHELAERGFSVVLYDRNAIPGGKARSMAVAGSGTDGARPLPCEHGFRSFPGFYRHLKDTMDRIPLGPEAGHVSGNLVAVDEIMLAQSAGPNEVLRWIDHPAPGPRWAPHVLRFSRGYSQRLGIPRTERRHFVRLMLRLLSSCERRRFESYEHQDWWTLSGATERSASYRKFLGRGLARTLVAARARDLSARTAGYICLQLLQDMSPSRRGAADRILNGPTNDYWIDPWIEHLTANLGVTYRCSHPVEEIESDGDLVTGIVVHDVAGKRRFKDEADHYVLAVPGHVISQDLIRMGALKHRSAALQRIGNLRTAWMNGIHFYLRKDVRIARGHVVYVDSPWALTSISQAQFWSRMDIAGHGDGAVNGVLSVVISDWNSPGGPRAGGKPAATCTRDEIVAEVWDQMKRHLNDGAAVLADENLHSAELDASIRFPVSGQTVNDEPLLINTKGSWQHRPNARLPEVRNLYLAGDYVRTHTDLACMEGANEAARRAVNAILDDRGHSRRDHCAVWRLREPLLFAPVRAVDRVVYSMSRAARRRRAGGSSVPPGPSLPRAVQTAAWFIDPTRTMESCRRRYGDVFMLRFAGEGNVVFLADSEAIRTVFGSDPATVQAGEANMFLAPVMGAKSVVALEGSDHLQRRRLLLPRFHGEHLESYESVIEAVTAREVDSWPQGRPFALRPRMQAIAIDVMLRILFGSKGANRLAPLGAAIAPVMDWGYSGLRFVGTLKPALGLRLWPGGTRARFLRCMQQVDDLVYAEIARRRTAPDGHGDMLALLLGARDEHGRPLSDREVRDEVVTLLVSGNESTAATLAWSVELLLANSSALARLSEELDEDSYLDGVVKETLRLRPVVPLVGRILTAPMALNGYQLPERTKVVPCAYLVHRRPDLYPEPDLFRPERFLDGAPEAYGWIPFGGGVRRCIGASFAQLEVREVLRTMLARVDLLPVGRKPEAPRRRGVNLVPARDGMVTADYATGVPSSRARSRSARAAQRGASSRA